MSKLDRPRFDWGWVPLIVQFIIGLVWWWLS